MDQHCKTIKVKSKEWEKFSNASFCHDLKDEIVLRINSVEESKGIKKKEFKKLDDTKTKLYQCVCIKSSEKQKGNVFLIKEEEKEKAKDNVLLISGEFETSGLEWQSIIEFLRGQIEADENAFKCGIIQDPIYEILRTISRLIGNRHEEFSITITGERELAYHNKMTKNIINVNLADGSFMLNNSETEYNEYMPPVSKESLVDFRREKRVTFAERLHSDLFTVLNSDKIKETWGDCELTIYLGRNEVNILCGRGDETKNRKIINKVGCDISVIENPTQLKL